MSSYKIFNYKTFDIKTLQYANPEKTRGGAYFIRLDTEYEILFNPKEPFVLNSGFITNEKGTHMSINLKDTEFGAFIKSLDEYNVDYIHRNCKLWFGNDLPMNVIKQFYVSNMDADYNLILQIPMVKKQVNITVFNEKKNVIDYTELVAGSPIVIVVRHIGLKFLKRECVMDLDVVQIMTHKPISSSTVIIPQLPSPIIQLGERLHRKELLIDKTDQVRIAFEEAERAQLIYQELQKKASELAHELHNMQTDYDGDADNYGDEGEDDDEDDEDADSDGEEDGEDGEDGDADGDGTKEKNTDTANENELHEIVLGQ